jgi:hypothetical protein
MFFNRPEPSKIVFVQQMAVTIHDGTKEYHDACSMEVIPGGALMLYRFKSLGKAGSVKVAVKAYGVGQWLTCEPIQIPKAV